MTEYNLLHNDRILLFDGGMGSLLVKKGLLPGEKPEYWNLSHPEVIEEIHSAYIAAGADIINTNTFGAYRHKLGDDTERVILAAIENAKRARDKSGKNTLIALDMGPLGKLLAPLGELDFEEAESPLYKLSPSSARRKHRQFPRPARRSEYRPRQVHRDSRSHPIVRGGRGKYYTHSGGIPRCPSPPFF